MQQPFVAYYRVSTARQGHSRLGLEAQQEAVSGFVAGRGELVESYTEVESGRNDGRPELQRAIAACRRDKATLVIAKLDRLARSVYFISSLMEGGVDFIAVDMPEANRLTVHILAAVAEHEREMISKRTSEALKAARARGGQLGNPRATVAAAGARQANVSAADKFADTMRPIVTSLREDGMSLRGIAEALNRRGLKTRTGRQWKAQTVKGVLGRTAGGAERRPKATARRASASSWVV